MSEYLDSTCTNELDLRDRLGRTVSPGTIVRLVGNHPHAGRIGEYTGVDVLASGKGGAKVDFGGDGCYVLNASQWEVFFSEVVNERRTKSLRRWQRRNNAERA